MDSLNRKSLALLLFSILLEIAAVAAFWGAWFVLLVSVPLGLIGMLFMFSDPPKKGD